MIQIYWGSKNRKWEEPQQKVGGAMGGARVEGKSGVGGAIRGEKVDWRSNERCGWIKERGGGGGEKTR